MPLGSIDIDSSPLGSIPLGSIPLGSIEINGLPLGSIPLNTIPLGSIGGWEALLDGTDLENVPLQTITLDDVLALVPPPEGFASLTLSDVGLEETSLQSVGLASLALGSLPLGSIPVPDGYADWCDFLESLGFSCEGLGVDINSTSLLALDIQGVPLGSIPLGSIPLGSIPMSGIDIEGSPLGSIPLGSIPLGSIPLGSIPLGSIPLGSIPLGSIPLGSIAIAGTPLGSIPLGSIELPEGFTDWCAFLASSGDKFSCASLGVDAVDSLQELAQAILDAGFSLESSPLGSIPMGSIPLVSVPLGSIPLGSIPLGSIPLGSIPLGSIPLGSIALAGTPLGSIPLGSISLPEGFTDLCTFLASSGDGFSCTSLGVTEASELYELVESILATSDLSSSPLGSIPLGSIPLGSIPLGSIPLGSIPLGSIAIAGTPLGSIPLGSISLPEGFTDWCVYLASSGDGFTCAALEIDVQDPLHEVVQAILATSDLSSSPLGSIPLGSIPLGSIPLGSIPLGSIPLGSIPLGSIPLSSVDIAGNPLGSIPLGSISLPPGFPDLCAFLASSGDQFSCEALGITSGDQLQDLVDAIKGAGLTLSASPLGSISMSSLPLGSIPLGSIPLDALPVSAIPLGSIPLGSITITGTPLGSIPLGSISLPPRFPDLCTFLASSGDQFSCGSLGITSGDELHELVQAILAIPSDLISSPLGSIPLTSLPLGSIPLGSIPLGSIPLGSIPLGSIPLGSIPLGSIAVADSPLGSIPLGSISLPGDFTDWCAFLAASGDEFSCDNLEVDAVDSLQELVLAILDAGFTLESSPLGSIPLGSIPLGSIPLGSIPLGSIPLGSIPLGSIPLGSIAIAGTPLGSIPLGSIDPPGTTTEICDYLAASGAEFSCESLGVTNTSTLQELVDAILAAGFTINSSPLGSIPLGSIPLGSIPLGSIPLGSIPLGSIPLGSIPLGSIDIAGTPLGSIPLGSIDPPGETTVICEFLASSGDQFTCSALGITSGDQLQHLVDALGTADLSSSPLGSIPLDSVPLGSIPLGSIPLGSIDIAGTPLGSIPLGSIELPDGFSDLCTFLASFGDQFSCIDLGITSGDQLQDLVDALGTADLSSSPLGSIPLGSIPLGSIPLGSIPLGSIPVSAVPLGSIPLGSINITGTPLGSIPLGSITLPEGFADWCDYLASAGPEFSCAALSGDGNSTPLDTNSTLQELVDALLAAGLTVESSPLGSIPLGSIPLGSIPLGSIPLGSIPLGSIPLGSIPLGSIAIAGTPLGSIPLGSIDIGTTPLGSIPLGSIPLGSISLVVNCAAVNCDSGTLGDADTGGAISDTALLGDLGFYGIVTVEDIVNGLPGADEHDISYFLSFFYGDLTAGDVFDKSNQDLGGLTLEDILVGMLRDSDYPWEELPLDEIGVLDFAGTGEFLHYHLSFSNDGDAPVVDPVVSVDLPDSFVYVPGTSAFAELPGALAPLPDPGVAGSLLTWFLNTEIGPSVTVQLDFQARPGLQLGTFSASATASSNLLTESIDSQAPVQVTEHFEPQNNDPDRAPIADPDVLYISHISTSDDVDFFQIEVPAEPRTRIAVFLSHLSNDDDLVMYRPETQQASSVEPRNAPLNTVPVEDQSLDVDNTGNTLSTETLQDIQLQSLPLVSISANRSTNDETVETTSRDETGFYTLQLSGYNGSFSDQPYVLRVKVTPGPPIPSCSPRSFPSTGSQGTLPNSISSDVSTLFIVNQEQLGKAYGTSAAAEVMNALGTIAARADVTGAVIPVEGDPAVAAAYATWNLNPCSPATANSVVSAIISLIESIRDADPDLALKHIVLVGTDEIVPMARIPDLTRLSNESDYVADLRFTGNNALLGAFLTKHVLSDDAYGDFDPIPWLGRQLFLPDVAVGRLVETPDEIVGAIDKFIFFDGNLDPKTAFTTGYDFLTDGAEEVDSALESILGPGSTTTLINEEWTAGDVIGSLNPGVGDAPADILSVNAHYDHYRSLPADQSATGQEEDLFTTLDVSEFPTELLQGRIFFSMGCHAGLSVSDVLIGSPTADESERLLDWPQVYAQQGAVYAANTGYGYGDTEAVALSERLMVLFAERLDGTITVGEALTFAKQEYFASLGVYGVYDEKALVEATFYGLPMYRVGTGTLPPAPDPIVVTADSVVTGLDSETFHFEASVPPATADSVFNLVTGPKGSFFEFEGKTQVTHYRPIQPRTEFDVTAVTEVGTSDVPTTAHGAIITGLVSEDVSPFDVAFARPVIDLQDNEAAPEFRDVVFPSAFQSIVSLNTPQGPRQRLVLIPGQFFHDASGTGVQRLFTSGDLLVYYSNSDDFTPPQILRIGATLNSTVSFVVEVTDEAPGDVVRVLILLRDSDGSWSSVDLVRESGTNLWTGSAQISGEQIEYLVQAVDSAGNVAISTNKAKYFKANPPTVEAGPDQVANEGDRVSLAQTTFAGFGIVDVLKATIDWGDGSPLDESTVTQGVGSVPGSHVYTGDRDEPYFVTVCVGDQKIPPAHLPVCDTLAVTVNSVAPTVVLSGPASAGEGNTETYTFRVIDPGEDTFTFTPGSPDCGVGGNLSSSSLSGSFECNFPDGPASSTVNIQVTDSDGDKSNISSIDVTVGIVPPTVVLSGPASASEGETKSYTFTTSNPGEDTFDFTPGFPDCGVGGNLSSSSLSGSFDCTFPDGPAIPTVRIQVTDSDGGKSNISSIGVTVSNVLPTVEAGVVQTADEGTFISLDPATFSDPGFDNTAASTEEDFTATVDWGDGTSEATGDITLVETPGDEGVLTTGTVQASHAYGDNGSYSVTVCVRDDDMAQSEPSVCNATTVIVGNVAPTMGVGVVQTADEGTFINLDPATFSDLGFDNSAAPTEENFTATVDWGDGTSEPAGDITLVETSGGEGVLTTGTVQASHAYGDNGSYSVTVCVTDDDEATSCYTSTVNVNNVVPAVDAGVVQTADEGTFISLDPATFSDPGFDNSAAPTRENFTATVDWGDGTSEPAGDITLVETSGGEGVLTTGSVQASHAYGDDGLYTVKVCVTDDEEATNCDTTTVNVNNVAPTVDAGAVQTTDEGTFISLDPATFSDPGFDNPAAPNERGLHRYG